ncbi:MAG: hypothetical protein ACLQVF_37510 [Isosphaeraceae bacterium]
MHRPVLRVILFFGAVLLWWVGGSCLLFGRLPSFPKLPHHDARSFDPFNLFGLFLIVNAGVLAVLFCGCVLAVLAAILVVLIRHVRARIAAARLNRVCRSPNAIDVHLSDTRLKKLRPDLYETRGNLVGWLDRTIGNRATLVFCIRDHLRNGDSRSAVVLSLEPLMIAAYAEGLDCIALLHFPEFLAHDYDLHVRDRLLSVNRYTLGGPIAADLEWGALSSNKF